MNHLMIDIETLDVLPTAAFPSIAAIPFDLDTGLMGKPFYRTISLDSLFEAGLTVGAGTLKWWMDQNHEIAKKMFKATDDLPDVMRELTGFIHENDSIYLWGNSARFDLSIIENAYRTLKLETPWKHYNERCYRTLSSLFKEIAAMEKPKDAHDPIVDAQYQITRLCAVHKVLRTNSTGNTLEHDYAYACSIIHDLTQNESPAVSGLRIRAQSFLEGKSVDTWHVRAKFLLQKAEANLDHGPLADEIRKLLEE